MIRRDDAPPSVFAHTEALLTLTRADWDEAAAWANAAKRLVPDMEPARWQGIMHGYACGLGVARSRSLPARIRLALRRWFNPTDASLDAAEKRARENGL